MTYVFVEAVAEGIQVWGDAEGKVVAGPPSALAEVVPLLTLVWLLMLGDHQDPLEGVVLPSNGEEVVAAPLPSVGEP